MSKSPIFQGNIFEDISINTNPVHFRIQIILILIIIHLNNYIQVKVDLDLN